MDMLRRIAPLVAGLLWASSALAADINLLNVSYDPTRELYAEFNKAFAGAYQKETGKSVEIKQSHGGSGSQARAVIDGLQADVVTLALAYDIDAIASKGLTTADWQKRLPQNSSPYTSTIVFLVRKGNPKGIKDWDDLLKPGVNVVTPNPFSSGSAKWNLLAPYTAKSNGGTNAQAGLDYVSALVKDHVTTQPKSGREASDTFLQGTGDALISYENEAIFLERGGDPVEHVTPPTTFKIENPLAVVKTSTNLATAKAFNDYLYTPAAQTLLAQAGFRPVDEAVAKEYASSFPAPSKLWTIADLGGWKTVDKALFAKDTGTIAVIYDAATK